MSPLKLKGRSAKEEGERVLSGGQETQPKTLQAVELVRSPWEMRRGPRANLPAVFILALPFNSAVTSVAIFLPIK